MACTLACAQSSLAPSAVFVQAGTGEGTHSFTTGLVWDWSRQWSVGSGRLGGSWEVSLSGWSYPSMGGRSEAWLGQAGLVPTFRYRPGHGASPWFFDAGVGLSFTTNVYQTERKRFSTSFNFADHLAVGRDFGAFGQHQVALRLEHFSNAGIKQPNPGQNFIELRYAYRLR
jgi:hypothetical protein